MTTRYGIITGRTKSVHELKGGLYVDGGDYHTLCGQTLKRYPALRNGRNQRHVAQITAEWHPTCPLCVARGMIARANEIEPNVFEARQGRVLLLKDTASRTPFYQAYVDGELVGQAAATGIGGWSVWTTDSNGTRIDHDPLVMNKMLSTLLGCALTIADGHDRAAKLAAASRS